MIVNIAALIAGAWWLHQKPLLPDLTAAVVLVPLAALWLLAARRKGAAALLPRLPHEAATAARTSGSESFVDWERTAKASRPSSARLVAVDLATAAAEA